MTEREPIASLDFQAQGLDQALEFLKGTRSQLRQLRLCRVWRDRFAVFDINGDRFEIRGIGYQDADIMAVMNAVNAAYNPQSIHQPTDDEFKEFKTGRRYPWAVDRVM